ncbi:DUF6603 domain-containing protein [Nitrosospira sp. NpAV]|uniref:DUF6603 domain-containing protein n=1 Tax=Nitrosospira sp. NpAV TaxID=58133 RepID=UPI0005A2EF08|nr:DUF6603 domain-containing protein [Nitrosospira sp. NpAV]KIO48453.1 hypothetical protein SQ11_12035 [Nitrosospira sp. NpAV]
MAGTSDKVFLRVFKWFQATVAALEADIPATGPASLAAPLADALRTRLGLELDKTSATIDPEAFAATRAEAESLAIAALVTGETLAALKTVGELLSGIGGGNVGLDDLSKVIRQINRIVSADPGKPPSAYSIGKLLLILSGDADEPDARPPARRLVYLIKGQDPAGNALSDAQVAEPQMILGLVIMAVGTILDRSFSAPNLSDSKGWVVPGAAIPVPALATKTYRLIPGQLEATLGFEGPQTLYAALLTKVKAGGGADTTFQIEFKADGGMQVQFDLPALLPLPASIPPPRLTGTSEIGILFKRASSVEPLILGNKDSTHFSIGELSGGFTLKQLDPKVEFDLKDGKLVLKIGDDPFLGAVLGDAIEVALTFGLIADAGGGLRLKDGTGLKATIPLEKIPNSPVQIPFLTFEMTKAGDLNKIDIELSGSFQVLIGPFSGSIDRLGTVLRLDDLLAGGVAPKYDLKPPSGVGLGIDAGIVKGGGFLLFDPEHGEYGGILDIRIAAIGVKAIGLLSTKNPGGWSLLLIITAQLPPIQLGFGFTLTGIGGLLGVQHTVSVDTLSQGLASGSLDSFLFPQNPIANAPQIINQLRTIFPFKAGGFVIGPMLELGWGTPSLVTARVGVLIEASQIVFVGQVIVQLPPLVEKSLAILRLQVDFAGGIVFDPLKIWFDGMLRDSRVVFISLTGQFAFRAIFGDKPSFLISAGGFHPRFTDLPPGLPSPFQRIGADLSIGIVGMQFRGYFAVTSATVQGGSSMRVWGDVGIAAFEGGFEFDAIIYIVPKFRFEVDLHVWAGVEVFGIDFASVDIYGLFAGPGRWHIVGRAEIHTPWPLPDFSFHVDESWGEDRATTVRRLSLAAELKIELEKTGNWSAQLPQAGDAFATFAKLSDDIGILAHPNAVLQFVQKRMPLDKKLAKLGTDGIDGETKIAIDQIVFGAITKVADRKLDDNFSAAQFLELTEDETFAKPSFDRFEAGFEVGQRDYLFGVPVADVFDYEEVNLSTPMGSLLSYAALTETGHMTWAKSLGAANRSELRRAAKLKPAVEVKINVNPPPLQTIDLAAGTMKGAALTGAATHSYWHAEDYARGGGAGLQVVEAFETVQTF